MYLHLNVLFFRLSEAGLLTIGRLAESGSVKLDRSLLTALVQRVKLNVLRPRPPAEFIPVDPRWVPR